MTTEAGNARTALVRKSVAFDGTINRAALEELSARHAIKYAPQHWGFSDGSVLGFESTRGSHRKDDAKTWARLAWRAYTCD